MNKSELRNAVEKLNLELLKVGPVEAETQDKINALLDSLGDPDSLPETEEDQASLQELLSDSVSHFEASHPTVTSLLNQVMSLLTSIGV